MVMHFAAGGQQAGRGPAGRRPGAVFGLVFALGLAALLAAPGAAAERRPSPFGVIGQDDRVPLASAAWPWRALGRVNQADGGYCTGALVAKDAVLTAAHCLMDRATGLWRAARELVFVAGYRPGEDAGFARGREIVHAAGAIDPRHPALKDIPNDWALLYLDHSLPVRPVPLHTFPQELAGGARLLRAGYGLDRPHLLSLHDGCSLLDRLEEGRVLVTDCDGTRGDSGSPLLLKQGKNIWIVGVTSAVAVRGRPGSYAVNAAAFAGRLGGRE